MSLLTHLHQQRHQAQAQRVLQRQPLRSLQQHAGPGVARASARGELFHHQYR